MRGVVASDMSSTCAQSGLPRPLGGFHPIMEPSSPASACQYNSLVPKQEPIDHEERNDSGISGSDFQSSSPGSDRSDNLPYSSPNISGHAAYYPMSSMIQRYNGLPMSFHNEHNPLTPPSSESIASPKNFQCVTTTCSNNEDNREIHDISQTTLTPCTSPEENTPQASCLSVDDDNALKRLQMAMDENEFLPNLSDNSEEYANKSNMDVDSYDGQATNVPKVNSHGKLKQYKCKQCNFVAFTKNDFWQHSRVHIKDEKLLSCTKCPFVTEYKHHFEYHMRNHSGSKPFTCPDCNYSCVNKSMLNSHRKSHSAVYQYSCADCPYVSKYCHSLKIHLRKHKHKPSIVLNPDGTPNPFPVIDVYGTRRGPKMKFQKEKAARESSPQPEPPVSFPLGHLMWNAPQMQMPFAPLPFFAGFPSGIPNPFLLQNLKTLLGQNYESRRENQESLNAEQNDEKSFQQVQAETEVLDLSKPATEQGIQKNRRKGRAFKLVSGHNNVSDEEELTTMFNDVEVVENAPSETSNKQEGCPDKEGDVPHNNNNNNSKENNSCQYCAINFGDAILYAIHMGYHGFENPFTCNMCGEECKDKVTFFLHIARTPHS